jgi:mannose-6-phosphate isomerase-like protein (cupin superfamily)
VIRNTKNVAPRAWGVGCQTWELLGGNPDLAVFQERMPPGTAEVEHLHERARQFFFVISGALTIRIGDSVYRLGPGDGLEVPPGEMYLVHNDSGGVAEFLAIANPTTVGDRKVSIQASADTGCEPAFAGTVSISC